MPPALKLKQKKYGYWTIIKDLGTRTTKNSPYIRYVRVRCRCGKKSDIKLCSLRTGKSTKCQSCKAKIHGLSRLPEYKVWQSIKQRCNNPKSPYYKHYGGRGVKVCKRWSNSFSKFLKDMGIRPKKRKGKKSAYSIDRINNDGNYKPSNCRWATWKIQNSNRKRKNS